MASVSPPREVRPGTGWQGGRPLWQPGWAGTAEQCGSGGRWLRRSLLGWAYSMSELNPSFGATRVSESALPGLQLTPTTQPLSEPDRDPTSRRRHRGSAGDRDHTSRLRRRTASLRTLNLVTPPGGCHFVMGSGVLPTDQAVPARATAVEPEPSPRHKLASARHSHTGTVQSDGGKTKR
jgi:hypothetical protein